MDLNEADWFNEIKYGNLKAFDNLFKDLYASLCIYASDILKNRSIAEEVVQDVFLKLWNNRETININTSLKSYLYRMVHNQSLNFLRDRIAQRKAEEISVDDISYRSLVFGLESSYDLLNDLIGNNIEQELERAITELPPQCREIFCLARYQMLSYREIAEKLDISVSTVKSQMLRSIGKLKSMLNPYLK